jgi:Xaa-Pro aminopeptidase
MAEFRTNHVGLPIQQEVDAVCSSSAYVTVLLHELKQIKEEKEREAAMEEYARLFDALMAEAQESSREPSQLALELVSEMSEKFGAHATC